VPLRSTVLVDVRDFIDRRAASLSCHQSQIFYFVEPYLPRSLRKLLSAAFGYVFQMTEAGRKRIPIGTARLFARFPTEGLVLRKAPADRPEFFTELFRADRRLRFVR